MIVFDILRGMISDELLDRPPKCIRQDNPTDVRERQANIARREAYSRPLFTAAQIQSFHTGDAPEDIHRIERTLAILQNAGVIE